MVLAFSLLVFLMPTVAAHITHPPPSAVLEMDGFKLAVTPTPSPVTVDTPTVFVLVDVDEDPEHPLPGATIRFTTESDATIGEYDFEQNGTIWETQPIRFNQTGTIAARVILQPENESQGRFSFSVYRALPFEFAPLDATSDPTARVPYALTFRTLDPMTSQPHDALTDLRAMIFPAGTSPTHGDRFENLTFAKNGTGEWTTMAKFEFAGPWLIHLNSDSGGFQMLEAAPWQVDVLEASDTKDTPAVGLTTAVGGVLVAAALVMRSPPRRAR